MKQFAKLESVDKMPEASADIISYFQSTIAKLGQRNPASEVLSTSMLLLKGLMDNYQKNIRLFYTPRSNGKYPALSKQNLKALQDSSNELALYLQNTKQELINSKMITAKNAKIFDTAYNIMRSDHELLSRIELKGNLSLPQAIYKHTGKAYEIDYVKKLDKGVSFFEYSKIFEGKSASEKSVIKSFINKPKEQLLAEYKAVIESNPRYYEYSSINSDIPPKILNTGSAADIEAYLNSEAGQKITYPEQLMLRKHMEIAGKMKAIEDEAKTKSEAGSEYGDKPEVIDKGEDDIEIKVSQPAFQSSANGCWSCAGQMLLQSRGVKNITQEDIRAYRPNLTDNDNVSPEMYQSYNLDTINNLLDKADSVLAFAPNSMMHETQVYPYDEEAEKAGYTVEQYINNTVDFLKKQIKNAIRNEKSPVALLLSGHYITVTGLKGDMIRYKDSANRSEKDPDKTHTASLKDFVKANFTKVKSFERLPVTLTWISDIKLSRDGKKLYGVPSEYTSVDENGKVILPPEEVQNQADANLSDMNKNGNMIQRYAGKESADPKVAFTDGGIVKVERVYLPKQLKLDHLKRMAERRDAAEEQKLINNDKEFLDIDRNKDAAAIEPAPEAPAEAPAAVNDGHYSLDEIKTEVNAMFDEFKRVDPKWILTRSGYSNSIRNYLDSLKSNVDEMAQSVKNGQKVPAELNKNTSESLTNTIECIESYLNYKNNQFIEDPTRKNASTKQINEQPKLKSTIDILEKLYSIKNSLDEKKKGPNEFNYENQMKKQTISEFRKNLLSDKTLGITNKMRQEATYKNATDIDPRNSKFFSDLEDVFGMRPDKSNLSEHAINEERINGKKVSEFGKLTRIDNTFKAIGSDDPIDKLSNKDFIAIAAAASTTRETFNSYKSSVAYEENSLYFVTNIASSVKGDPMSKLEGLEFSRQMAAKALTSYKNGDKKPLAHLIKEGITNMVNDFRFSKGTEAGCFEAMGELCQRMNAMMERDPELKSLAIKDGLKMSDVNSIDLMTFRGKICRRNESYNKMATNNNPNMKAIDSYPWSKEQRMEKYSEVLLERYFLHVFEEQRWELDNNPEHLKEIDKISEKSKIEQYNISKRELKEYKAFYSKNREMLAKVTKLEADLKNVQTTFKEELKGIERKMPEALIEALRNAEQDYKDKKNDPDKKIVNKAQKALKKAQDNLKKKKTELRDKVYDDFNKKRYEFDKALKDVMTERINSLETAKEAANKKDKPKLQKEIDGLKVIKEKLEDSDLTVKRSIIEPAVKKSEQKHLKVNENFEDMKRPEMRFKVKKMMRDYVNTHKLYDVPENEYLKLVDKVRLSPDRMLEMIHNKEPLNSNEIQKEYKNRVSQEQKIFQDNMKQMSRRPEIYRR